MISLKTCLEIQRAAFAEGAPDLAHRQRALRALSRALRQHRAALLAAVDQDFGGRAAAETLMLELFPLHAQIRHAYRQLPRWMRRRKVASPWYLLPSRAFYQYQPLGVVGVMGAWNYPVLLTLGPAIEAIAAGNHVVIKPSELAPRTAELIASILASTFTPEHVTCVTGGPETGEAFASLPFDHLFFTGSTRVGRLVAQAAAQNLVPVTLELGGKSPAIIHPSYPLDRALARILSAKLVNAGQTCVAPDYLLLPAGQEAECKRLARTLVAAQYPRLSGNPDYTSIAGARHRSRLQAMLEEARIGGAECVDLAPDGEPDVDQDGQMGPMLIFGVSDAMRLSQEEIFGPLLPVISYRTLEEAIAYVNARPRPLALYYFDEDRSRQDELLRNTLSGGVTVNDCLYHLAQPGLPFGGVGASGNGHYHGFDGFVTFSKKRPVMVQRRLAATDLLRAPWSRRRWMVDLLLRMVSR